MSFLKITARKSGSPKIDNQASNLSFFYLHDLGSNQIDMPVMLIFASRLKVFWGFIFPLN